MRKSTFVIAEAGSNHGGRIAYAAQLTHIALWAGADAVKFQYCSNYERLKERRKISGEVYPFSIQKEWLGQLKELAEKQGLEFMCTVYIPEDIEVVAPYVKRFKISALEKLDGDFLNAHRSYGKPILASGRNLYCVSKYPCPDNELFLKNLIAYEYDGLSDHTKNPLTGALAVAMGAEYIETHFRAYVTPKECPDYEVARDPAELKQYIANIRQAEVLLGDR